MLPLEADGHIRSVSDNSDQSSLMLRAPCASRFTEVPRKSIRLTRIIGTEGRMSGVAREPGNSCTL